MPPRCEVLQLTSTWERFSVVTKSCTHLGAASAFPQNEHSESTRVDHDSRALPLLSHTHQECQGQTGLVLVCDPSTKRLSYKHKSTTQAHRVLLEAATGVP